MQTAVSLLNADRGCIFERDNWNDDEWIVVNTFQFDKKRAEKITKSPFLSQVVGDNELQNFSNKNSTEVIQWYKNEDIESPQSVFFFPMKMFKWPKWIMHIETDNRSIFTEAELKTVAQLCHQVELFLQRNLVNEKFRRLIPEFIHETRAPLGIIKGYSDLLHDEIDESLHHYVEPISKTATRINDILEVLLYFPIYLYDSKLSIINSQSFQSEIAKVSPSTIINFDVNFAIYIIRVVPI